MLTISHATVQALRAEAGPAYAERLRASLAEAYPQMLPRFPKLIQLRIVNVMLARAFGWGLTRQNALFGWCALMLTVAANFDAEPEIHHALDVAPQPRDSSVMTLTTLVSPEAWTRAEQRASSLAFFVPPAMEGVPLPDQLAEALGIVLHDHPQVRNPMPMVDAALAEALALGLADTEDAALVIAVARAFWGPEWAGLIWASELRRERRQTRVFIEAVRLRLALEFGRFV